MRELSPSGFMDRFQSPGTVQVIAAQLQQPNNFTGTKQSDE